MKLLKVRVGSLDGALKDVTSRRHSVVGTATRYRLDASAVEFQLGREFPHPSRPVLGPAQSPIQWVPGHSRG